MDNLSMTRSCRTDTNMNNVCVIHQDVAKNTEMMKTHHFKNEDGQSGMFNFSDAIVNKKAIQNFVIEENHQTELVQNVPMSRVKNSETIFADMTEADQGINFIFHVDELNENSLAERACSFGHNDCKSDSNQPTDGQIDSSCRANGTCENQSALHGALEMNIAKNSSASSVTGISKGNYADIQNAGGSSPETGEPDDLIEIGRHSVYMDAKTGEYYSVLYGSLNNEGKTTINDRDTRSNNLHRYTSCQSENFPNRSNESCGSWPLSKISLRKLVSHKISDINANNSFDSVGDMCQRCSCVQHYEDFFCKDTTEVKSLHGEVLEQNLPSQTKRDVSQQFSQTYPGTKALHLKPKTRLNVGFCNCECCPLMDSKLTLTVEKCDAVCHGCVSQFPSYALENNYLNSPLHHPEARRCVSLQDGRVCSDNWLDHANMKALTSDHFMTNQHGEDAVCPDIVHAKCSPKYFKWNASHTSIDEENSDTEEAENVDSRNVFLDTEILASQAKDQQKHHFSKCLPRKSKPVSALTRDCLFDTSYSDTKLLAPQTSDKSSDERQRHTGEGAPGKSGTYLELHSDKEKTDADGRSALPVYCTSSDSELESSGQVCQKSTISGGTGKDAPKDNIKNIEDEMDEDQEIGGERRQRSVQEKALLRRAFYTRFKRNFVAYLCCAPNSLVQFGLSFHHMLETWGLPIFISARDEELTGARFDNMAKCVQERCNGKIIVVLSNDYENSEECLFLIQFVKTLDPDSKNRNIIPVMIDKNVQIPNILRGLSIINYNYLYKCGWLKEKLISAIAA